jgi:LacI family transcriptional regulator
MIGRVTQADVAKRVGVHVTTVSLALRNHQSLPAATKQRIRAVAEQMGYKPDPALSALMAYRKTQRATETSVTLGYLTNGNTEWSWKKLPAHADFFGGAITKAEQLGFQLAHFWLGQEGLSHRRLSDILLSRGINGLIISSYFPSRTSELQFDWPKFSAVKIDYLPHALKLHSVSNDQRSIIQLAMQRVKAAGYQRIGAVIPRTWNEAAGLAWSAGFLAEQEGIPERAHIPILFYDEQEFDAILQQITIAPNSLTKLAAWIDRHQPEVIIGYGPFVRPQLETLGLAVPDDIAFVDFYLESTDGDTAGVRQNCRRVGELAVEILAGQLQQNTHGLPEFQTTSLVEGTWIDGASLPSNRSDPSASSRCKTSLF